MVWEPRKKSWQRSRAPQWAKKVRKGRAGHLVPQGPLERRPCSPSTNCTPPGPRTAARADRRNGERVLGEPVARAGRALIIINPNIIRCLDRSVPTAGPT